MKSSFLIPVICLSVVLSSVVSSSADELKIATVDMQGILTQFEKTKEADARINESRTQAVKELEQRISFFSQAESDAKALKAEIEGDKLSESEKAEKLQIFNGKLGELQSLQNEVQSFQQTREKHLSEKVLIERSRLLEQINKVIAIRADKYDLILNKSATASSGIEEILFVADSVDLTPEILAELNGSQGKK